MGVFDKIKNALFEVEYVEVDEKPKKEKKLKPKEKAREIQEEKPIAKKIVLPGKKEEKIEHLEEEDLKDDNFEVRPKNETVKETPSNTFKFMDDSDFKVEHEPQIVEVLEESPTNERIHTSNNRANVSDYSRDYDYRESEKSSINDNGYRSKEVEKERESKPYGMDDSYKVSMHEYGTYDKKDEKVYFKPSPIISPIYGILDKNYKKEDVVTKKDIRITSNYSRTNVNVDDIRNKAFGRRSSQVEELKPEEETTFEIEDEDENLMVDLSNEKDKPEVKQVTVGDAMEYFQDLGLEYNVDYVDASKEKNVRKKESKVEEQSEEKKDLTHDDKVAEENISTVDEAKKEKKIVEVKDESNDNDAVLDDDDNLFDLIDSMYKEED